jgi:hypothetical protein
MHQVHTTPGIEPRALDTTSHTHLFTEMRRLTSVCAVGVMAALEVGCPAPEPVRQRAPDSSAVTSKPRAALTPWYRRARTLDLTGDGQPDSVRVEAAGSRPDSLRITLAVIVAGEEKHRETWGSSDELAAVDTAVRIGPRLDAFLRAQLDTVLASVVVQPIAAQSVRLMAEDSVVLAGLEPRPTHRISFSYGYETTVRLVWDAPRARFVRLWSCC